jgi:membrane fusion protein (multidrug efflux system)
MKKKLWITILILLLIFGSIFGFKIFMYFMIRGYMAKFELPPAAVTAEQITLSDWQSVIHSSGQLTSVNGVHLTSRASGMIDHYFAKTGDSLKSGEVILSLTHDDLDAQLLHAKAAEKLAKIELDQQKRLYAASATSRQSLDQAIAAYQEGVANVQNVEANIENHIVRAPFDGILGVMQTNLGQYVNPGDDLGMFVDRTAFWVDFPVTQQELSAIKVGQSMTFTVDSYPGVVFQNKIKYLDNYFSSQTYALMVRGQIQNEDLDHPLYPGMMINLEVLLPPLKNVIAVSQDDVVSTLYGNSVFVVEGDKKKIAKQVFVRTGEAEGSKVLILSGLNSGDYVVTSGQMKLQDGSPVVLVESVPADTALDATQPKQTE